MASNVALVDPNDVNINTNIVNGIPQYQDMYIFAELTAIRKGRTVLVGIGDLNKYHVEQTGLENTTKINFLGNNQNTNNPNYLNFTTNYYDGSSSNSKQYEGFGITNIKVVINASFIPQVSIQFVDIRGLAFFNQENSPYRILFDFPPPIFQLTIKGYYGRALTYQLHLVKYTSEFKAENGNYIIDAQFVAMTFAPLADVLLRYVINFPLIENPKSIIPNTVNGEPQNTFELITRLRNLYTTISTKIKFSNETNEYTNIKNKLVTIDNIFSILTNYNSDDNSNLKKNSEQPYLIIVDKSQKNDITITTIEKLTDYDEYVKSLQTPDNSLNYDKHLYIAVFNSTTDTTDMISPLIIKNSNTLKSTILSADLNDFGTKLKLTAQTFGFDKDISNSEYFNNTYNIKTRTINKDITLQYVGLDLTKFYMDLYRKKNSLNEELTKISKLINTKINGLIEEKLGMMPTIYNIFKIILNDVDKFFNILRKTSNNAEDSHNLPDYKNLIIGDQYADNLNKIFAFPLIIDRFQEVSGGYREVRVAPIELSKKVPFPELDLVNAFIDTFFLQVKYNKLLNLKSDVNADGTLNWIPISPIDSKLANSRIESPYINILNPFGNIPLKNDNDLAEIIKIILKRFYIVSQNTFSTNFYGRNDAIRNLFANSEAINLVSSVTSSKYIGLLKEVANRYKNNIGSFYTELEKPIYKDYYNFENKEFFSIFDETTEDGDAYVNKKNSKYNGIKLLSSAEVQLQPLDKNSDKLIDKFMIRFYGSGVLGFFSRIGKKAVLDSFAFTNENVLYVKDVSPNSTDNNNLDTRFISDVKNTDFNFGNKNDFLNQTLNGGNIKLKDKKYNLVKINNAANDYKNKGFYNITNVWADQLSKHDNNIYDSIIKQKSKLGALLYLSNFGFTLSPFSIYPTNLNESICTHPAAISAPMYLPAYIGALTEAIEGSDNEFTVEKIKNFFVSGDGKNLSSSGVFILADIYDIKNYLSENDKKTFKEAFENFYNNSNAPLNYNDIFDQVKALVDKTRSKPDKDKLKAYENELNPNSTDENTNDHLYYKNIIKPLIERTIILNFSEITFNNDPNNQQNTYYQPLKSFKSTNKELLNNIYFHDFFDTLYGKIIDEEKKINDAEKENENTKNDKDIVTQTYYSFKNINDKWLSSPNFTGNNGYPFNDKGKDLINSFAFVDRAMNPFGNTVINAEILLDMFDDPNISVWTALSQLLSKNGFEFFALQNFISYDDKEESWKDSFRINTNGDTKQSPAYVCMFVGGDSSYPTNGGNGFVDDGIVDIGNVNNKDFNTTEPNKDALSDDEISNPNFSYRKVKAFKVRFGEQNQSMFTDMKIESKEYPDTNESIQILSRLAGDNTGAIPIPKGQNLYNLYENRAYRATITGMGNAMIQPTQYFQLENVPIFNGAYLILSVEHTIEPNRMITSFSGTKILKYPVPRVLNPASIYGFDGSTFDFTNVSSGDIVVGMDAMSISEIRATKLNSVFGVDVSYAQPNFDWNKAINTTAPDDAKLKFALIKVSQGIGSIDDQRIIHANGAKNAGLKIGYYHYAQQYTGSNIDTDIITDAQAQANHFINTVNALPKPDFPLMLDMENFEDKHGNVRNWSVVKKTNDLWIDTFIKELKNAKYDTIIYSGKPWLNDHITTSNFNSIPLWHAQWLQQPETSNPTIANAWKDWTIWQFSHSNDRLDLNLMKKDFFDSHKA